MADTNDESNNAGNNLPKDIVKIYDFLDKHFSQMPTFVRVMTYFVFLSIFTYACFSALTMEIVFSGKIERELPKNAEEGLVDFYYVEFETGREQTYKTITTNDDTFYFGVPFFTAVKTKFSGYQGKVIPKVIEGKSINNPINQPFHFKAKIFSNEFEPVTIKYAYENGVLMPQKQAVLTSEHNFELIKSAVAGGTQEPLSSISVTKRGRLYIEKIETPHNFDNANLKLMAVINENNYLPPISRETRSARYSLPITQGKARYYAGRFYFELPENLNKIKFVIEYSGNLPFLQNKTYKYLDNTSNLQYDEPIDISFDNNIKMTLRYSQPYELVYFQVGANDRDYINYIKKMSLVDGLYFFNIPSITGKTNNAIFASSTIPVEEIKKVIIYVKNSGLILNTIQCSSSLKTAARNQIQIGYSAKYKSPKSELEIEKLLQTRTDEEFRKLCDVP